MSVQEEKLVFLESVACVEHKEVRLLDDKAGAHPERISDGFSCRKLRFQESGSSKGS